MPGPLSSISVNSNIASGNILTFSSSSDDNRSPNTYNQKSSDPAQQTPYDSSTNDSTRSTTTTTAMSNDNEGSPHLLTDPKPKVTLESTKRDPDYSLVGRPSAATSSSTTTETVPSSSRSIPLPVPELQELFSLTYRDSPTAPEVVPVNEITAYNMTIDWLNSLTNSSSSLSSSYISTVTDGGVGYVAPSVATIRTTLLSSNSPVSSTTPSTTGTSSSSKPSSAIRIPFPEGIFTFPSETGPFVHLTACEPVVGMELRGFSVPTSIDHSLSTNTYRSSSAEHSAKIIGVTYTGTTNDILSMNEDDKKYRNRSSLLTKDIMGHIVPHSHNRNDNDSAGNDDNYFRGINGKQPHNQVPVHGSFTYRTYPKLGISVIRNSNSGMHTSTATSSLPYRRIGQLTKQYGLGEWVYKNMTGSSMLNQQASVSSIPPLTLSTSSLKDIVNKKSVIVYDANFGSSVLSISDNHRTNIPRYIATSLPEFQPLRSNLQNEGYFLSAPAIPDLIAQRIPFTVAVNIELFESSFNDDNISVVQTVISTPYYGIGIDNNRKVYAWVRSVRSITLSTEDPAIKDRIVLPLIDWYQKDNVNGIAIAASKPNTLNRNQLYKLSFVVDPGTKQLTLTVNETIVGTASLKDIYEEKTHFSTVPFFIGTDMEVNGIGMDPVYVSGSTLNENPDTTGFLTGTDFKNVLANDTVLADMHKKESKYNIHQSIGIHGSSTFGLYKPHIQRFFRGLISDITIVTGTDGLTSPYLVAWYPCRGEENLLVDASGGIRHAILRSIPLSRVDNRELYPSLAEEALMDDKLPPFLSFSAAEKIHSNVPSGVGTGWHSLLLPVSDPDQTNTMAVPLLLGGNVVTGNHFSNHSSSASSSSSSAPTGQHGTVWYREPIPIQGGFTTAIQIDSISLPDTADTSSSIELRIGIHSGNGLWDMGSHDSLGIPSKLQRSFIAENSRINGYDDYSGVLIAAVSENENEIKLHTTTVDNFDWIMYALQSKMKESVMRKVTEPSTDIRNVFDFLSGSAPFKDYHASTDSKESKEISTKFRRTVLPLSLPSAPSLSSLNGATQRLTNSMVVVRVCLPSALIRNTTMSSSPKVDVSIVGLHGSIDDDEVIPPLPVSMTTSSNIQNGPVSEELDMQKLEERLLNAKQTVILSNDGEAVPTEATVPVSSSVIVSPPPPSSSSSLSSFLGMESMDLPTVSSLPLLRPVTLDVDVEKKVSAHVLARTTVPFPDDRTASNIATTEALLPHKLAISLRYDAETSQLHVFMNGNLALSAAIDLPSILGLSSRGDEVYLSCTVVANGNSNTPSVPVLSIPVASNPSDKILAFSPPTALVSLSRWASIGIPWSVYATTVSNLSSTDSSGTDDNTLTVSTCTICGRSTHAQDNHSLSSDISVNKSDSKKEKKISSNVSSKENANNSTTDEDPKSDNPEGVVFGPMNRPSSSAAPVSNDSAAGAVGMDISSTPSRGIKVSTACEICTFINEPGVSLCGMCGANLLSQEGNGSTDASAPPLTPKDDEYIHQGPPLVRPETDGKTYNNNSHGVSHSMQNTPVRSDDSIQRPPSPVEKLDEDTTMDTDDSAGLQNPPSSLRINRNNRRSGMSVTISNTIGRTITQRVITDNVSVTHTTNWSQVDPVPISKEDAALKCCCGKTKYIHETSCSTCRNNRKTGTPPLPFSTGPWECSKCTFLNENSEFLSNCEVCGTVRERKSTEKDNLKIYLPGGGYEDLTKVPNQSQKRSNPSSGKTNGSTGATPNDDDDDPKENKKSSRPRNNSGSGKVFMALSNRDPASLTEDEALALALSLSAQDANGDNSSITLHGSSENTVDNTLEDSELNNISTDGLFAAEFTGTSITTLFEDISSSNSKDKNKADINGNNNASTNTGNARFASTSTVTSGAAVNEASALQLLLLQYLQNFTSNKNPGNVQLLTSLYSGTGRWNSNMGNFVLEPAGDGVLNVDIGYLLYGRYGYSVPLKVPNTIIQTNNLSLPSMVSIGENSNGSYGPRYTGIPDHHERGRIKAVSFLTAPVSLRNKYDKHLTGKEKRLISQWRMIGYQTTDTYGYTSETMKDNTSSYSLLIPALNVGTPFPMLASLSHDGSTIMGTSFQSANSKIWNGRRIAYGEQFRSTRSGVARSSGGKDGRSESTGYAGLLNMFGGISNTCYQNSLLQSLFMTDELRNCALSSDLIPLRTPSVKGITLTEKIRQITNTESTKDNAAPTVVSATTTTKRPSLTQVTDPNYVSSPVLQRSLLYGLYQNDDALGVGTIENEPGALVIHDKNTFQEQYQELTKDKKYSVTIDNALLEARQASIANRFQWLFARMAYSQRIEHGTFSLKKVLGTPFRANGQQDCVEFFTSLANSVDEAWNLHTRSLSGIASNSNVNSESKQIPSSSGVFHSTFGGSSITVRRCLNDTAVAVTDDTVSLSSSSSISSFSTTCDCITVMKDTFLPYTVRMPNHFLPITGICVIVVPNGKTEAQVILPDGYERVPGPQCNKQRYGAPYVILAITRNTYGYSLENLPPNTNYETIKDLSTEPLTPITHIRLQTVLRPLNQGTVNLQDLSPYGAYNPSKLDSFESTIIDGYHVLPTDLNINDSIVNRGDRIYLGYKREETGSPITALQIIDSSQDTPPEGYTKINENLNVGVMNAPELHLFVKYGMPITNIIVKNTPGSTVSSCPIGGYNFHSSSVQFSNDGWIITKADMRIEGANVIGGGLAYTPRLLESIPRSLFMGIPQLPSVPKFCYTTTTSIAKAPITDIIIVPAVYRSTPIMNTTTNILPSPTKSIQSPTSLDSPSIAFPTGNMTVNTPYNSSSTTATTLTGTDTVEPIILFNEDPLIVQNLIIERYPELQSYIVNGWEVPLQYTSDMVRGNILPPTNGYHILFRRGEGCPIVSFDVYRGTEALSLVPSSNMEILDVPVITTNNGNIRNDTNNNSNVWLPSLVETPEKNTTVDRVPPIFIGGWGAAAGTPTPISLVAITQQSIEKQGYVLDGICGQGYSTRISGIAVPVDITVPDNVFGIEQDLYLFQGMYTSFMTEPPQRYPMMGIISVPCKAVTKPVKDSAQSYNSSLSFSPTSSSSSKYDSILDLLPPPPPLPSTFGEDKIRFTGHMYNDIGESLRFELDRSVTNENNSLSIDTVDMGILDQFNRQPIIDICIVTSTEPVPMGYEKLLDSKVIQGLGTDNQQIYYSNTFPKLLSHSAVLRCNTSTSTKNNSSSNGTSNNATTANSGNPTNISMDDTNVASRTAKTDSKDASTSIGTNITSDNKFSSANVSYYICYRRAPLIEDSTLEPVYPLTDIAVVHLTENETNTVINTDPSLSEGYTLINHTYSGLSADLYGNGNGIGTTHMYLAIKRSTVPYTLTVMNSTNNTPSTTSNKGSTEYILDIDVLITEKDNISMPLDGYKRIDYTIGHSRTIANLNGGSSNTNRKAHLAYRKGTVLPIVTRSLSDIASKTYSSSYQYLNGKFVPRYVSTASGLIGDNLILQARGTVPVYLLGGQTNNYSQGLDITEMARRQWKDRSDKSIIGIPISVSDASIIEINRDKRIQVPNQRLLGLAIPAEYSRELQHATQSAALTYLNTPEHHRIVQARSISISNETTKGSELGVWYAFGSFMESLTSVYPPTAGLGFQLSFIPSSLTVPVGAKVIKSSQERTIAPLFMEARGSVGRCRIGITPWRLYSQQILRLVWSRDKDTIYRKGQLLSTNRVNGHNLQNMLVSHTSILNDKVECEKCKVRTEHSTTSIISQPPRHLLIQLDRMGYDTVRQQPVKCHVRIPLRTTIVLPPPPQHITAAIESKTELNQTFDIRRYPTPYGLYAIVFHVGDSANSGHYYAFARRSNIANGDLRRKDDPTSPWISFNDSVVGKTNWDAINDQITTGIDSSRTPYVLLYRQLYGEQAQEVLEQWEATDPGTNAMELSGLTESSSDWIVNDNLTTNPIAKWVHETIGSDNYNYIIRRHVGTCSSYYREMLQKSRPFIPDKKTNNKGKSTDTKTDKTSTNENHDSFSPPEGYDDYDDYYERNNVDYHASNSNVAEPSSRVKQNDPFGGKNNDIDVDDYERGGGRFFEDDDDHFVKFKKNKAGLYEEVSILPKVIETYQLKKVIPQPLDSNLKRD